MLLNTSNSQIMDGFKKLDKMVECSNLEQQKVVKRYEYLLHLQAGKINKEVLPVKFVPVVEL